MGLFAQVSKTLKINKPDTIAEMIYGMLCRNHLKFSQYAVKKDRVTLPIFSKICQRKFLQNAGMSSQNLGAHILMRGTALG